MPELPDVEIFKQYLDATSLHKQIEHSHVRDASLLEGTSRRKLSRSLVGDSFDSTRRRGKYLGAHAKKDGWLILHFGMTGELKAWKNDDGEPGYTALLLDFSDGSHLAYTNTRRLGRIRMAGDFDDFIEEQELGPDALEIDLDAFRDLAENRRASIKALLMNQKALAGIGNIYADEILFHAGVRPDRAVAKLSNKEIRKIHRKLVHVLKTAIERRADPEKMPRTWLLPRREKGASCRRCGGAIKSSTVGGRTTYWCPECQQ